MEITPSDIVEEILDPLMMSQLAEGRPSVIFDRLADNRVLLDFGLPDTVFTLTVVTQTRQ